MASQTRGLRLSAAQSDPAKGSPAPGAATEYHAPVLLTACLTGLALKPEGYYVDCTAGGGGHSSAILARLNQAGTLLSLDRDAQAREACEQRLSQLSSPATFEVVAGDFRHLGAILQQRGVRQVDGILADLGVSSHQLDEPSRGFSFRFDGPLDMRMDPTTGEPVSAWLARASVEQMAHWFTAYGEERYARGIARAIARAREVRPLETTQDLVQVILQAIPAKARREKHPAKRVFQALRIGINGELAALEALLQQAPAYLAPGGRLVVISFHSLEDRRVKQAFRFWQNPCQCPKWLPCQCGLQPLGQMIQPKGVTADEAECAVNPRAHSARVRIFERNASPAEPVSSAWQALCEEGQTERRPTCKH